MRYRILLLLTAVALATTATVASASDVPHGGAYSGPSSKSHHVTFTFDAHHHTVKDFRLGGIHVFASVTAVKNSSGHWEFHFLDTHYRVRGTWTSATGVHGSMSRTNDPRTVPSTTFSATVGH